MNSSILLLITVASVVLAAAMGAIAWRVVRDERRRSEARIATLAREIGDDGLDSIGSVEGLRSTHLFEADVESTAGSRTPIVLAAGALVVGTVLGLAVMLPGGRAGATPAAGIGESRDLKVAGGSDPAASGVDLTHLTAVVLLFDTAGAVVATGRSAVDAADLLPGAQTPFSVSVGGLDEVGRYRVSFRTDDDRVVPHVDKRDGA
jgi:ferric-dicitrate binding protein FerR (iron transport regulator)